MKAMPSISTFHLRILQNQPNNNLNREENRYSEKTCKFNEKSIQQSAFFEGLKAAKLLENFVSGAFSTFLEKIETTMPKKVPKIIEHLSKIDHGGGQWPLIGRFGAFWGG